MSWIGYITGMLVTALLAVVLFPPILRLAVQFDWLDYPGHHKRHKRPIPIVGGALLFVTVWSGVAVGWLVDPGFFAELAGSILYVFSGSLIIFLVGLSDDLRPLSAWTKLFAQVATGLLLFLGGLRIDPISVPFLGSYEIGNLSAFITIIWVVGLTNAVNLIDGLDGLAGGVSLIGALTLAVIGGLYQAGPAVVFAYVLIGFLVVFLWYNRYPARVFLGDSGALQIGFYFAVISLLVPVKSYTAAALYLPLLALGMPLLETGVSIVRRLVRGKNVMQADRRHLFHYLALAGLSPKRIVTVFYLLSAIFGLFAVAMYYWDRLVIFGILVLFMVVIFALFFILMANLGGSTRRRAAGDQ